MNINKLFLFTLIFFIGITGYAQPVVFNQIKLKNITLTPSPNIAEWIAQHANNKNTPAQVILYFSKKMVATQQELLLANGIYIQDKVAPNTYTAVIKGQPSQFFLSSISLASIFDMRPEWKYDSQLFNVAKTNGDEIELMLSTIKGLTENDVTSFVSAIGGAMLKDCMPAINIYKVSISSKKVLDLAGWYGILYISPFTENVSLNMEAKAATRANLVAYNGPGGLGLTGEGVTIGVGDNTTGQYHTDLKDRIINYNPTPYTNHGVHINGIVGGAGIIDPKGEGHAPHATLVDHLYNAVWEQTGAMVQAHNMTITNNSYASVIGDCGYAGKYDVSSLALDKIALQYDEVLHVFAAGNDGYLNCSPFPAGFATVNGGYQPAKNNIVVTSTDKHYINASDGGRGPVKDGRLKPEMTAVGVNVFSTTRSEGYLIAGGTSMACPEVAGGLGLLTQQYRKLKGNVNPKAALLKALMLNGTMDIGNPGPDYRYGFGFMDLSRSVDMINKEQYATNTITTGAEQLVNITVPPNTAQLKVMLCWHDAPGNPMSVKQLVNDLDLEVIEPSTTTHKPLILDATPANINNNATEGVDKINNSEQVTIYDPAPGAYTIKVKGTDIETGSQFYAVAYDFVPTGLLLSFPNTASQVKSGDSMRVYWFVADRNNATSKTFTLEFSTDDGQNWITINNNIPADQRTYTWFVPDGTNSGKCRMRITRANTADAATSNKFIVNTQPEAKLSDIQCPGYIRFHWNAIANASGYKVFRKTGPYMQEMGSTNDTTYTFSGLSPDSFYYVAVCPVIDGLNGYRSIAVKRRPNDGNCAGDISDGDITIEKIASPVTGRKNTSTELKNAEPLQVVVKNLDDVTTNHYRISYSINNAPWQWQDYNTPISATSSIVQTLTNIDMTSAGAYSIKIAVQNLLVTDPVTANDSVEKTVKQLNNDPVDINAGFTDGFETMGIVNTTTDSMGISTNDHWDYARTDTGHLRSYVNPGITIAGNRSVSMDALKNLALGGNQNYLTGTFNFVNYKAAVDEIRMEFDYIVHGTPKFEDGNEVWVRGNDTAKWQSIYAYETGYASIGKVQNSGTLSLTDGLQKIAQDYSSSFQVKFGQHDSALIASRDYGNGLTLDNVKIYTVQNDAQLVALVSPQETECGITGIVPITITIKNGVNQTLNNVIVSYQLDKGSIVNETLPPLAGKKQLTYSFQQKADLSASGAHILSTWINAAGDTYRQNDSILNYTIHNQPLVVSFPYLETFETNDGFWYTEGINSSWAYGVPASPKINKAVSGNKVWKTNLAGNYNNSENSYLYSPCFDISAMKNPTLRFKMAMDIENCGMVMCDMAYMEYSFNGKDWLHLGAPRQGTNWYNDSAYIWTEQNKTEWREALTALPKGNTIRLRFVFISDQGATFEGLALDDIEVFDQQYYTQNQILNIYPNPSTDGKINIDWSVISKPEMQIVMTDIMGKEVYRTTISGVNPYNQSTIQTPHFHAGMYFMRIHIGNSKFEYKMIYL